MSNGMNYVFDANQFEPRQGLGAHPVGRFPATITNTSIVPTADKQSGMFAVEFTSPSGMITKRYNLWNQSAKAVEIAQNELSALCHAVRIFKVDMNNEGASLRNAKCMIEVAHQRLTPEQQEKKDKGENVEPYVEVKKVFDTAGIEPKSGGAAPQNNNSGFGQQQPQNANPNANANPNQAPMTNNGGGWGNNEQQQPNPNQGNNQQNPNNGFGQQQSQAPQGQGGAWGGPGAGQPQQEQQQNNAQGGNSGNWSQGQQGNAGNGSSPPWGAR